MISQSTSSSIWWRTRPRRRCRFGRVRSSANTWRTSRSVCDNARPLITSKLTSVENGGTTLHSTKYHLLPADLRAPPAVSIAPFLSSVAQGGPILSPDLPTLLLFECVLVYIAPEASQTLIQWFVDHFASSSALGAVVYEMFGLNDSFGAMMVQNLKVAFTPIPVRPWGFGIDVCHSRLGVSRCRGPRLIRHSNPSRIVSRGTTSPLRKPSLCVRSGRVRFRMESRNGKQCQVRTIQVGDRSGCVQ